MSAADALCDAQGDPVRRALAVAFGDDAIAFECATFAFLQAHRRWRTVSTLPDPTAWVDVTAVRHARRWLRAADRRWHDAPSAPGRTGEDLGGLPPRVRVALVLHALRGRRLDDIAAALDCGEGAAATLVRDGYERLGADPPALDGDDDTILYAS